MKELLNEVQAAVSSEYERASDKFGKVNNSPHESYAVILEEFEEAIFEGECFKNRFQSFWAHIKENDPEATQKVLPLLKEFAEHAAAEWIQVAAMCYKATIPKEAP